MLFCSAFQISAALYCTVEMLFFICSILSSVAFEGAQIIDFAPARMFLHAWRKDSMKIVSMLLLLCSELCELELHRVEVFCWMQLSSWATMSVCI